MALRTNIIREPGLIQYNGAYFYSKEAITITQADEFFDIPSVSFGKLEDRVSARNYTISLTPVGAWENLGVLFPYFSTLIGSEIYGSSDTPLTVWTQSGRKYTFNNVALTTLPDINPKVGATLLGELTFTALIADGKLPGDSDAYFTLLTEQSYPGDSNFNASNIITRAPVLSWGSTSPWQNFYTVDGVQIKHAVKFTPVAVNGYGVVGMRLADYQVTAQFQPAGGFEMSDILTATGGNQTLGVSPNTNDFVIEYPGGSNFYVEFFAASLRNASFKFGTGDSDNLVQGLEARATRLFSGGTPVPLAQVATGD